MRAWIWRRTSEPAPAQAAAHVSRRAAAVRACWAGGLFALGAAPALHLAWRHHAQDLGADPLATLVETTGWWAMAWLLGVLAVPLVRRVGVRLSRRLGIGLWRREADWNPLVRQRRQMGLWCFAWASAHLALHALLDSGSAAELLRDAGERPFVALGLAAWLLLLPLALTSNRFSQRLLKRNWPVLHRLVYAALLLALAHELLQAKAGQETPWIHAAIGAGLVASRLHAWLRGDRSSAAPAERHGAGGRRPPTR